MSHWRGLRGGGFHSVAGVQILAAKRLPPGGFSSCPTEPKVISTATATVATLTVTQGATGTSSATSSTSSSVSGYVPPTNVMLALDCPNLDGQHQTVTLGSQSWTFKMECDMDYLGSVTIVAVTVYALQDCLKACASYNRNLQSNGCIAIEFGANMTFLEPNDFGTCWLKNGTGTVYLSGSNPNPHAAAVLVS
ncbi:hypothetical protein QBC46DRAFT_352573 [Diplogelasinospora grovesii]|uniref:Apple domain-containing protein n=1 Tax=Diplogelasinospora grovesii TaxID=303347 RepID=A0AAN6NAC9_9PEZI|nr:hypothetical protein QBC46DRAFT_352573 [Diplogelasinospora grovesii]